MQLNTRQVLLQFKKGFIIFSTIGLSIVALSCNQTATKVSPLRIAAASNFQFVLNHLVEDFNLQSQDSVQVITSSSGKLSAQIIQGAPFDLFLSANKDYPLYLKEQGLTTNAPKIFALGRLVLWSAGHVKLKPELLTDPKITRIAIANPEVAPFGQAALESLNSLEIYSQVSPKLVFGESIAQTNQFITTGAAQIGFTALAVVKNNSKVSNTSYWTIPIKHHEPINQTAVVLKNAKNEEAAIRFYAYLSTQSARDILKKYGYSLP